MSSTSSYVSEKPLYGKAAWLSTVSSVICGYFSYGFIRGWPNYWSNMQNHLNDCNERGQNCTQEQFLHRDQEHSDWSAEVGNNTLHPDWVTKDHISSTSSFMLLGVSIGATLCGLILPMIGNRKATMAAGIFLLGALITFSEVFKMDNFTLLYIVSFAMMGMPMGVIHTACQNSIKATVPFERRGFAMTLFTCGNTLGQFLFPYIFTFFGYYFNDIVISLKFTGVLFLILIGAGLMMTDSSNEPPKLFDATLFKRPQYILYVIHAWFAIGAYFGSLTFLAPYLVSKLEGNCPEGETDCGKWVIDTKNSVQLSMGIVEGCGRLLGLYIADKFWKENILQTVYIGLAVCWILFTFDDGIFGMTAVTCYYVFSSLAGFCTGCYGGVLFALLADVLPSDKHAVGAAMNQLSMGTANFIVVKLFGSFFEEMNAIPYYGSACLYVAGTILLVFVKRYNHRDDDLGEDEEGEELKE